jgi:hypothetical protein
MHLVLAPHRQLQRDYGPRYGALSIALDAALAARAATGIVNLIYDPEDGLPDLGVAPAARTPSALVAQIVAIADALAQRNGIIESLWIIGGPTTVPFGSLPNPMRDRDGPILSDCVYGLANAQDLLARWPVGRTPDAGADAPDTLPRLLSLIAAAHRAGPRPAGPTLGISTARWSTVSAEVFRAAGEPAEHLLLAPPLRSGTIDRERLASARVIYCNLHGVLGSAAWYGQALTDGDLLPALQPADLAGIRLDRAVVITQACFGARLSPAGGERAMALTLLEAGTAVIGAIGLSYGAPDPPPSESDLLAQHMLLALRPSGQRLGEAILAAHTSMLRDLLLRQGQIDADDAKTLLEFVLYGDPAMVL